MWCPVSMRVLDIGTGTGRNALFLATRGFKVDAIDGCLQSVVELNAFATDHALPIHAFVQDICQSNPTFQGYGVVLLTFVLHFLKPKRAMELLARARAEAGAGTVHVLGLITTKGDFCRRDQNGQWFYPEPDEMWRVYAEAHWQIHSAFEQECEMHTKHRDGSPTHNVVSFVAARKV